LLPATGGRDVASGVYPGASCYPIGTPASACPRRHLLTGRPWRLVEASCTLRPMLCIAVFRHFPAGPSADRSLVWRGWDSNPRSRAHEAREDNHSSTALRLTGENRRCSPASIWPAGFEPAISGFRSRWCRPGSPTTRCTRGDAPVTPSASTPGGTRTRSFRVEGPASSPFDHGGIQKLRRQGSNLRLAVNSRASCHSTTPERVVHRSCASRRPQAARGECGLCPCSQSRAARCRRGGTRGRTEGAPPRPTEAAGFEPADGRPSTR
jgi:hypothetical protein